MKVKTPHIVLWTALLALAPLAGCAAPSSSDVLEPTAVKGGPGEGGGRVGDTPPTVQAFSGSLARADNSGTSVEEFTGVLFDANAERDLIGATITVTLTGAADGVANHTVSGPELRVATEPSDYAADGFKVWDGAKGDGVLHFKFVHTFPLATPLGTYTFTPSVTPARGEPITGPADTTIVEAFSEITIEPLPVLADGTSDASGSWGGWEADPGARNVVAANYLKLVNTGQLANATVVVDFTDGAFVGVDDANFSIPIAGNVEFAWWEDASPAESAPGQGNFTFQPANADGSTTLAFSGLGNIIYVTYRIVQLPDVLPVQNYTAAYTATEL